MDPESRTAVGMNRRVFLRRALILGTLTTTSFGVALLDACASPAPAAPTAALAPATAAPAPPTSAPAPPTAAPTSPPPVPTTPPPPTSGPVIAPTAAAAPTVSQTKAANQLVRVGATVPVCAGIYPAGFGCSERVMLSNLWLPPLVRDDQHQLHPGLLMRYDANSDASVWTLQLDPKARWSDGSKLTASDLKAGWEANNAPVPEGVTMTKFTFGIALGLSNVQGQKEHGAGTASDIPGLVVVDDGTLQVNMATPDPAFPAKLALPALGIMKADQWAADPFVYEKPECLFNGPYKTVQYDKQANTYAFEPNPQWWGPAPTVQRVEFKAGVDEATLYALWQNNQIDVGFWTGPILKQLFANDGDKISRLPYGGVGWGFLLNVTQEPVDDINVRKALMHGADYVGIVKSLYGDSQNPSLGIIPPELPCWNKRDYTYKFDVDMAKSFLAQSKYGSADKLPHMEFGANDDDAAPDMQAIIEQWRTNLGIRVDIVKDNSIYDTTPAKQYAIAAWSIGSVIPDTAAFLTSSIIPKNSRYWGVSHYDNPQIQTLVDQATSMFPDNPARCGLVQQAEQLFLDDYAGVGLERVTYEYWVKPWIKEWHNNVDLSAYTMPDKIWVANH
jgi:peptide/nickel transport system substrate-binding protein